MLHMTKKAKNTIHTRNVKLAHSEHSSHVCPKAMGGLIISMNNVAI